jgi:Fe-S oxidoreductase
VTAQGKPLVTLPTLKERENELKLCVYCPKLCRASCPVSNAEPRETLTPWGKISTAYFVANESVPLDNAFAAPAWACTGCGACRDSCDHRNDVTGTLLDARDAMVHANANVVPAAARRVIDAFADHAAKNRQGVRELCAKSVVREDARDAVLVGCAYVNKARSEASDVIDAAAAFCDGGVAPIEECCGLPLLLAGDKIAFAKQASRVAEETKDAARIVVADAGCAQALRTRYREVGVMLSAKVITLVEVAAENLDRLACIHAQEEERVRYHDPCQLGRGLGIYEAPRIVLTRLLGRAPDEFDRSREHARCSGGGGLVPLTMPETASDIARARIDGNNGRIVTACASSLLMFRKTGRAADDIATWIARGADHARTHA